jgi:UDP-2-acetamido-3-amino-2,3-dideoxy-glucuronate N-acetyltransferase
MSAAYKVHPSAIVDPGAQIGEGTAIWHFCHVMSDVVIGCDCNIGQNVFIANDSRIGNKVKIQNNVSVYGGVILEDEVFCGPSMVFTNVLTPRAHVNRHDEYTQTRVGRGATIGANATVVCGHDIGRYAMIGAGAVVTRTVPDYALVVGNPARQSGWVCRCGEVLHLVDDTARCARCGDAYTLSDGKLKPQD